MKTKHCIVAVTALALAWSGTLMAASKFYKWVDENGVTHYTQSAPPEGTASKEVSTHNTTSSDSAEEIKSLQAERAKRLKELSEAQKKEETKKDKQEKKETSPAKDSEKDQSESAKRCEQHRTNLQVLKSGATVQIEDPKTGKMVTVNDQQRQEQIRAAEDALKGCPPAN